MKAAIRIPLIYSAVSAAWLTCADWAVAGVLPVSAQGVDVFKGGGFALLTSALLFLLMRHEKNRRDAIEHGLRRLAISDPLTGLLKRASFVELLEDAVKRAGHEGHKVGVVFVDLDGFKAVNDVHGHPVGDRLLVEVANRIRGVVRSQDHAGRFGGDEFVVLVHGDREEGCKKLAERLVYLLNAPIWIEGRRITLSASVGFAMYPDHGQVGDHLLRAADQAMYRVKGRGKNAALEAFPNAA